MSKVVIDHLGNTVFTKVIEGKQVHLTYSDYGNGYCWACLVWFPGMAGFAMNRNRFTAYRFARIGFKQIEKKNVGLLN